MFADTTFKKIIDNFDMYHEHPRGLDLFKLDIESAVVDLTEFTYTEFWQLKMRVNQLEKENALLRDMVAD